MKYQQINKSKCYCITLCRAANAITAFYDEGLKQAQITTKQFSLLINLARLGEASTVELADFVNLERSTVTRNLKILLENGWVCDRAKPGSRSHRYAVTETGEKKLEETEQLWEKMQEKMDAFLGRENAQMLRESLHRLQELQQE